MSQPGALPPPWLDAAVEFLGRAGRKGTLRVRGGSMKPSLGPGDLLAVEFTSAEARAGDLLLFRQEDYLVVHRLLGRGRLADGRPCLRTRGDGAATFDPPLEPSRVLGRVLAVDRGEGWRDLRAAGARCYARALALHGRLWAGLGAVASRVDRLVGRKPGFLSLRSAVGRVDRAILVLLDGLLFRRLHPRTDPPGEPALRNEPAPPAAAGEEDRGLR